MLQTFKNVWQTPELRKKLLYTLLIILIYRIGGAIPVPYLDNDVLASWFQQNNADGNIFSYLNVLSGDNFSKGTIFALSVAPYINAQIIIQLLTYALPPLEKLAKEGMEGRKKLDKITRYTALGISVFQAWAYYLTLKNQAHALMYTGKGFDKIFSEIVIITCFTAGSFLTIWLGNQISEKGIGNGISMLLFAGIIARIPTDVMYLFKMMGTDDTKYKILVPLLLVIYVLMIALIVFMNNAERRVPIAYAKRVVGRKQYGGQNTYLPVKVSMAGVLPIIFAMAFMSLPSTLEMFITPKAGGFYEKVLNLFKYTNPFYGILYFILIIAFNYFYISMQYNPLEIANNLRQSNGSIPGIRPGKPTVDYLRRVLSKITLVGAFFLGLIALFPIVFGTLTGLQVAMGGTSILIVVSVALETARTMESQMMMRHHKGFLE
ncbi:MAG: preprotein translocase subunit SecY [Oscillospiraceae bacterium]